MQISCAGTRPTNHEQFNRVADCPSLTPGISRSRQYRERSDLHWNMKTSLRVWLYRFVRRSR
jgi:hypothetical protein